MNAQRHQVDVRAVILNALASYGAESPLNSAAADVAWKAFRELVEAADGVDGTHGPMLNGPVPARVKQFALNRMRAALQDLGGAE